MSLPLNNARRIAFVLAATDVGPMILNRMDFNRRPDHIDDYGPGVVLLECGAYETIEANVIGGLLMALRQTRGDGVVMIDGGANIGALTVNLAGGMQGWGTVIAIEPQRQIYYALGGNIALNNLFNVIAVHGALSDENGVIEMPVMSFAAPFSSGSMSLLAKDRPQTAIDMQASAIGTEKVKAFTVDSLGLGRLDLLKLDIEGMEPHAIRGAVGMIAKHRPVVTAEHLFCGQDVIKAALPDYGFVDCGVNTICIPKDDPIWKIVNFTEHDVYGAAAA